MITLDVRNAGLPAKALGKACAQNQKILTKLFQRHKSGDAFLDLPDDQKLVREIGRFAATQKKNRWEAIVVLGIGGSALGLIALRDALLPPFGARPRLLVVDNIDPTYTHALFEELNWKKTLFIVISKSGTTPEPMLLYGLVLERLKKHFQKGYQKHFVFITDAHHGLLREIADKEGIQSFEVPQNVGGRFSVLSAVGLLPAALAGVDIARLLRGARRMRDTLQKTQGAKNPALALAVLQYLLDRKHQKIMTVLMPYSSSLFRVADWYRQLLAESLGKNEHTGPTPINALGTTDQHSQLQLYQEGPNNKWFIFLRVRRFAHDPKLGKTLPGAMAFLNGKTLSTVLDAAYQGTALSLTRSGRPNVTIEIPQVDAEHVGELLMLFECQVALLGVLYRVNAFDQPGVEASKKITQKILSKNQRGFTLTEMLIVIGIIGVLFGISSNLYRTERDRFIFNDSLSRVLTLIQTARNYATTSRAAYNPADGTSVIPAEGYGVDIRRSATPGESTLTLFANTSAEGAEANRFGTGDLTEETYTIPTQTVFEGILPELKTAATIGEAVILFRPPLADTFISNNGDTTINTLYLRFSNRLTSATQKKRFISINRTAGFPELELLN